MKYNKINFWTNTQGVFQIEMESNMNDLISFAVNKSVNEPLFECNFNKCGDSFYIRTEKFAIRISNRWGQVGSCNWTLNRDSNPDKYQMVVINYEDLKQYKN